MLKFHVGLRLYVQAPEERARIEMFQQQQQALAAVDNMDIDQLFLPDAADDGWTFHKRV